jgi:hypothetical protein
MVVAGGIDEAEHLMGHRDRAIEVPFAIERLGEMLARRRLARARLAGQTLSSIDTVRWRSSAQGCGLVNLADVSAFGVKGRIGFRRQPNVVDDPVGQGQDQELNPTSTSSFLNME